MLAAGAGENAFVSDFMFAHEQEQNSDSKISQKMDS